jgi:hypothetical protein
MTHRHLTTTEWTPMAIESLFERGVLKDWREFSKALRANPTLVTTAVRVADYHEDRGSVAILRILVDSLKSVSAIP